VSPAGTAFAGNANGCTEGGVEIKGANTTFVCNGKKGTNGTNGTNGADGEPWAVGGLLPPKATETGSWGSISGPGLFTYPVSFFLPLSSAPEGVFIKPGQAGIEETAKCPGFVNGAPTAKPGKLCVYAAQLAGGAEFNGFVDTTAEEAQGVSTAGALLLISCPADPGECPTFGTFAVTGPEQP
jgi:hypothetical protein